MEHHPDVASYIAASTQWPDVVTAATEVLRGCGLQEHIKWGKPVYSHDGSNVVIVQEFADFMAIMFTKGALLDDPAGLLHAQGPNTRSAMRMQFTSAEEVQGHADDLRAYVAAAVAVEDAGLEVGPAPEPDPPEELAERLAADPGLSEGWDSLTPGRRREYVIHISGAKKSATREARVEKVAPRIREGRGMRDR